MTKSKIEGMNCGHCVKLVTEVLSHVPGVEKVVEVSLAHGEAVVSGNADTAALISAVTEAGYEARVA